MLPPQNTCAAESVDFSDMKVSAKFLGARNPQNSFSKNHDDFGPPFGFRHFFWPEHTNCPIANRWFKRRVGRVFGFRITYFVFHGDGQSRSGVEGSPVRKENERDRESTALCSTKYMKLRPRNLQNEKSLYRVPNRVVNPERGMTRRMGGWKTEEHLLHKPRQAELDEQLRRCISEIRATSLPKPHQFDIHPGRGDTAPGAFEIYPSPRE